MDSTLTLSPNGLASRIRRACVLAVLMLITSCSPSASVLTVTPSGPVVIVAPSLSVLQVDDTVLVAVTVENISDLIAFEAHLSFNANVLEVIELKDGGFVKADFIVQNTFDNVGGTIDYAVAQIGRPLANGNGTLFEIVFRAKAQGRSPIIFRETQAALKGALFADPDGTSIQVSLINGSISVEK
jgi:hypothetical protein